MTRLIAIVGPTAVGKTSLAIGLASLLHSQVISGDSMQVYRYMDIGTAKPSPLEQGGIRHHLIDIKEPQENFSLAEFVQLAGKCIHSLDSQGIIPILAGGTGLYIKALLEGYTLNPAAAAPSIRARWQALAEERGDAYLHQYLNSVDHLTAAKVHPHDRRRLIRALEIYTITGYPPSTYLANQRLELQYDAAVVGLSMPRTLLYERIDKRVDLMLARGLVGEVAALLVRGIPPQATAMQAIGYKEMVAYLQGRISFTTAVAAIKRASRRYAKRQMTWFRRMPYIHWFDATGKEQELLADVYKYVAGKFNIG